MCFGDATVFNTIDLFDDILVADPIKSFNTPVDRDLQTSLGTDFVPGPFDVICRRGKSSFDHVGNRRFRILVALNLEAYVESHTRAVKSSIVNSIVDQIREASPMGGFVRQDLDTGEWFEVGTQAARDKVGHTVRDCVADANKRCREDYEIFDKRFSLREAQNELLRSSLEDHIPGKKRRRTWSP